MSLPEINSPNPIVIPGTPAVPETPSQTYNNLYMISLVCQSEPLESHPANCQKMSVSFCPYDFTNKTVPENWTNPFLQIHETIQDVWVEAERNPSFAQAMETVLRASLLIVNERDLLRKIATANEEDKVSLQSQLDAIHQQMGIV